MTKITLTTLIQASPERCFDLSRSIELHLLSTKHTGERAVAGRMKGLAGQGDTITWEAVHFGIRQRLTTVIEQMQVPYFFSDRMVAGAFKSMYHEHRFEGRDNGTLMTDDFWYETPYGIAGRLFDKLLLKKHMTDLLIARNATIRSAAEGNGWRDILK